MRRLALVLLLLVLVAGCSSGESGDLDLAFENSFDFNTQIGEYVFSGEAVDEGVVCPTATGEPAGIEDPEGNPLTFNEVGSMITAASEEFTAVFVDELECVDGSGGMTMRHHNAYTPEGGEMVMTATWDMIGTGGHDGLTGEGDAEPQDPQGNTMVNLGTGVARSS